MNKKHINGFTLIEIMIAITIIAGLSAVVVSNVNSAQRKGKVAQAVTDLSQMKLALATYYGVRGRYPVSTTSSSGGSSLQARTSGSGTSTPACSNVQNNEWAKDLVPRYLPQVPSSPFARPGDCTDDLGYQYQSDGKGYTLLLVNASACADIKGSHADMFWGPVSGVDGCGYWTADQTPPVAAS